METTGVGGDAGRATTLGANFPVLCGLAALDEMQRYLVLIRPLDLRRGW
jgi:hypothetical protein